MRTEKELKEEMSLASKTMTAYAVLCPPHAMDDRYYYWLKRFQEARQKLELYKIKTR